MDGCFRLRFLLQFPESGNTGIWCIVRGGLVMLFNLQTRTMYAFFRISRGAILKRSGISTECSDILSIWGFDSEVIIFTLVPVLMLAACRATEAPSSFSRQRWVCCVWTISPAICRTLFTRWRRTLSPLDGVACRKLRLICIGTPVALSAYLCHLLLKFVFSENKKW